MKNNPILNWEKPTFLMTAKEVEYRDQFSKNLEELSPPDIVKKYAYFSYQEIESLLKQIIGELKIKDLAGVGVELGSGCSILTSFFLNTYPSIEKIYSVEIVEGLAYNIGPKVVHHFSSDNAHKFRSVWGSFDTIELPDNSVDFVIEYDSVHHSGNLGVTLKEIGRILKPNGICIFLDRCHPNNLKDEAVEKMLDRVYSKDFLIENCYPTDTVLTRRENGEHEYRYFEWELAIRNGGLQIKSLDKVYKKITLLQAMYSLKLYLINGKKQQISFYIYLFQKLKIKLFNNFKFYINPMRFTNEVSHEVSVFVITKK